MHEREISIILEMIEDRFFEPGFNWPKYYFNQRSYSRWAAHEILKLIMDNPLADPSLLVEEFMLKMDYFSHLSNQPDKRRGFIVARNTADDILDIFNAMH